MMNRHTDSKRNHTSFDKKGTRALSMTLCAVMLVSCFTMGAGASGDEPQPKCDEAYYATMDYYGRLQESSVVKSYTLNGAASITDYGAYDKVNNLTDGTEPTVDGDAVQFSFANGAPDHFYFEGKTAKPFENLPWTLSVSYQLNGVRTDADQLAGKTGMVEIDIDAVPNTAASEYEKDNFVLTVAGMFNDSDILSLKAGGGQVQLLGNIRAVMFLAMPGETQHFAIQVGTNSFSFEGLTFLMVPATLSQLDQIKTLKNDKSDIENSYHDISGSLDKVLDALDGMSGSLNAAADGLDTLDTARSQISAGKGAVYASSDAALHDLGTISSALQPVSGYLESASKEVGDLNSTLTGLTSNTAALKTHLESTRTLIAKTQTDVEKLQTMVGSLESENDELRDTAAAVRDDLVNLEGNVTNLENDLKALRTALEKVRTDGDITNINQITTVGGMSLDTIKSYLTQAEALDKSYQAKKNSTGFSTLYPTEASYFQTVLMAQGILTSLGESYAKQVAATPALATQIPNLGAYVQYVLGQMNITFTPSSESDTTALTGDLVTALSAAAAAGGTTPVEAAKTVINNLGYAAIQQKTGAAPTAEQAAAVQSETEKQAAAAESGAEQLATMAGQAESIQAQLTQVDTINALIAKSGADTDSGTVNGTINQINDLAEQVLKPTDALLGELQSLLEEMTATDGLNDSLEDASDELNKILNTLHDNKGEVGAVMDDLNAAGTILSKVTENGDTAIDLVKKLDDTINAYQPTLQSALKDGKNLAASASEGMVNLKNALQSMENLMKTSGAAADSGTKQTLTGMADALRRTGNGLDSTDELRDAEKTITDKIDGEWDSHTGGDNNMLLMDSGAPMISLTSSKNASPASLQVLMRTQEIKVSSAKTQTNAAADSTRASGTFWSRVGRMFKDFWHSLTSIFH